MIEFNGRMHGANDNRAWPSKVAIVNDAAHAHLGVLGRDASKLDGGDDQGAEDGQGVPLRSTFVAFDTFAPVPATRAGLPHIGGKVECQLCYRGWDANSKSAGDAVHAVLLYF